MNGGLVRAAISFLLIDHLIIQPLSWLYNLKE